MSSDFNSFNASPNDAFWRSALGARNPGTLVISVTDETVGTYVHSNTGGPLAAWNEDYARLRTFTNFHGRAEVLVMHVESGPSQPNGPYQPIIPVGTNDDVISNILGITKVARPITSVNLQNVEAIVSGSAGDDDLRNIFVMVDGSGSMARDGGVGAVFDQWLIDKEIAWGRTNPDEYDSERWLKYAMIYLEPRNP